MSEYSGSSYHSLYCTLRHFTVCYNVIAIYRMHNTHKEIPRYPLYLMSLDIATPSSTRHYIVLFFPTEFICLTWLIHICIGEDKISMVEESCKVHFCEATNQISANSYIEIFYVEIKN